MAKIGIFFGTDTGRTRLIAKQIAKKLGDSADAPVNIGRTTLDDFLAYDALILDLEDAVKAEDKEAAREAAGLDVVETLDGLTKDGFVALKDVLK